MNYDGWVLNVCGFICTIQHSFSMIILPWSHFCSSYCEYAVSSSELLTLNCWGVLPAFNYNRMFFLLIEVVLDLNGRYMVQLLNLVVQYLAAPALHNSGFAVCALLNFYLYDCSVKIFDKKENSCCLLKSLKIIL